MMLMLMMMMMIIMVMVMVMVMMTNGANERRHWEASTLDRLAASLVPRPAHLAAKAASVF